MLESERSAGDVSQGEHFGSHRTTTRSGTPAQPAPIRPPSKSPGRAPESGRQRRLGARLWAGLAGRKYVICIAQSSCQGGAASSRSHYRSASSRLHDKRLASIKIRHESITGPNMPAGQLGGMECHPAGCQRDSQYAKASHLNAMFRLARREPSEGLGLAGSSEKKIGCEGTGKRQRLHWWFTGLRPNVTHIPSVNRLLHPHCGKSQFCWILARFPRMSTPYHARYFAHELPAAGSRRASIVVDGAVRCLRSGPEPSPIEAALFVLRSPLSKGVLGG